MIDVDVFASTDETLGGSDPPLVIQAPLKISIKPGKSQNVRLKIPAGGSVAAGSYFLIAEVNSTKSLSESNYAKNNVVSASPVTIV